MIVKKIPSYMKQYSKDLLSSGHPCISKQKQDSFCLANSLHSVAKDGLLYYAQ